MTQQGLPKLRTPLPAEKVIATLDAAARRGKLAGFQPSGNAAFVADAFAEPLDHRLEATLSQDQAGSSISFRVRMLARAPAIYWALGAVSVWPGVWLTDSMLRAYFASYDYATWMWYLPLTVLPLPFVWVRSLRRSRAAASASAHEAIRAIAKELDATIDPAQ